MQNLNGRPHRPEPKCGALFLCLRCTMAGSQRIEEHCLERRWPGGISMKKLLLCVAALAAMFATGAWAQDLSGNWQGTLKANKDLRIIVNFYKGDKDAWSAKM